MLSRTRARHHVVVAYLALFVALGGSAVAAKPLIDGSDVQDESLTSADIQNDSLTGDDILESSLGKITSAATADSATTAGDAGTLDGKDSTDFLGANAKAADASKLDGKDSADFKATCGTGWVYYGGVCWERTDVYGYTYGAAAARCGTLGGRLPSLAEFIAVANGGPVLHPSIQLDWASDVTADDEAAYINTTSGDNMDGVRAQSTSSYVRCVKPPAQALGTP